MPDDTSQKQKDLALVQAVVDKIKTESAQGKSPSSSILAKLSNLAAKYPDDPSFASAIASLEKAETQAMQEASTKQSAANLNASGYNEAEMRAFEEEAKRNVNAAARKYFNSAEMRKAHDTMDKINRGEAVSNQEAVDLGKIITSEENRLKRDALTENLNVKHERLMAELADTRDEEKRRLLAAEIEETRRNHLKTEKDRKFDQHITRDKQAFRQKHGREMNLAEEGNSVMNSLRQVEREILREAGQFSHKAVGELKRAQAFVGKVTEQNKTLEKEKLEISGERDAAVAEVQKSAIREQAVVAENDQLRKKMAEMEKMMQQMQRAQGEAEPEKVPTQRKMIDETQPKKPQHVYEYGDSSLSPGKTPPVTNRSQGGRSFSNS